MNIEIGIWLRSIKPFASIVNNYNSSFEFKVQLDISILNTPIILHNAIENLLHNIKFSLFIN